MTSTPLDKKAFAKALMKKFGLINANTAEKIIDELDVPNWVIPQHYNYNAKDRSKYVSEQINKLCRRNGSHAEEVSDEIIALIAKHYDIKDGDVPGVESLVQAFEKAAPEKEESHRQSSAHLEERNTVDREALRKEIITKYLESTGDKVDQYTSFRKHEQDAEQWLKDQLDAKGIAHPENQNYPKKLVIHRNRTGAVPDDFINQVGDILGIEIPKINQLAMRG